MRKGKISIAQLLISPILSELFELQHADVSPNLLASNWFSLYSSLKVYGTIVRDLFNGRLYPFVGQYVELDASQNGMLSRDEMEHFAKGRYSRLFIHRVFAECQTFGGEMVQ